MNAVTQARAERTAESVQQLGEVTASWQIMPQALMVIGWRNEKPAATGFVSLPSATGARGRYHLLTWSQADGGANVFHFIAAIQLPAGQTVHADEVVLLTGQGEQGGVMARLPRTFHGPAAFGTDLAQLGISSAIPIARFLLQTFSPAASSSSADIRAMLHAFLERASAPDGCVEMVGVIEDRCVLAQGWGAPPGPACDTVLIGPGIALSTAHVALFSRPDMRGNATGQMIILPPAATAAAPQLEAIVLLDRRGLRWRPVLPERRILTGGEAAGHLGGMLSRLQCDATARTLLQAHLRPRFDGRFTLYDNGHPVRLAVDLAAVREGAGAYLHGWLFDPAGMVDNVRLCGTRSGAERIDSLWTRVPRQDVTEAFRGDPALPAPPADQVRHGFVVHCPGIEPSSGALYLDVTFRDGGCGFVPLMVETGDKATLRTRLLASADLHKPSGMEIVERHLAPFLSKWSMTLPEVAPVARGWTTAIVVPLAEPVLPRALLSQFLRDRLGDSEGMVFVCGDGWAAPALETLSSLAEFYGIAHAILRDSGGASPVSALQLVAAATDAKRLLLLGPGTIGRTPGWRQALYAALDEADKATCLSPTVVYEDESVRFGGSDAVERLDAAPYVRIRRRLAGMPVSMVRSSEAEASETVSPACCLVEREVVRRQGASMATTSAAQEIALSLMMKQSGAVLAWLPAAQVYAADPAAGDVHENTVRVGHLVDGWCMRAHLEG